MPRTVVMATVDRVRSMLLVVAMALLAIAGDRLINMLWIGRPFASFSTRGWVYEVCAVAGFSIIVVAMMLGRRRS
jgi:hypothetical protein